MFEVVEVVLTMINSHMAMSWFLICRANDRLFACPAANNDFEFFIIMSISCREANVNIIVEVSINVERLVRISIIEQNLIVVVHVTGVLLGDEGIWHSN